MLVWFKYAKIAKLQTVALSKFSDDLAEEVLDSCLNQCTLGLSAFGNSVDEFLLRDC